MTAQEKLNKIEFDILEKVFGAEASGLLYPRDNKTVRKLAEKGYVEKIEKVLGRDRFGLIKVTGYVTTFKGNMYYCMSCK